MGPDARPPGEPLRPTLPPTSRTLWLAEQARAGDPAALGELLSRVRPRLERWAALRLGPVLRSHLDVEDLVQETLQRVWGAVSTFDGRSAKDVERWLRQILENRIRDGVDRLRTLKRDASRERPLGAEPAGRSPTASQLSLRLEEQRRVLDAMVGLAEDERLVLRLVRFEGRTYEEAGQVLGLSPKNVGVRLVRAMQALRGRLRALAPPA